MVASSSKWFRIVKIGLNGPVWSKTVIVGPQFHSCSMVQNFNMVPDGLKVFKMVKITPKDF